MIGINQNNQIVYAYIKNNIKNSEKDVSSKTTWIAVKTKIDEQMLLKRWNIKIKNNNRVI